ncbi:hypothetical protein LINGRAHAP2_LOCUS36289 [Linum grandiflorum]
MLKEMAWNLVNKEPKLGKRSRSELPEWLTYINMNMDEEEDCSVKVELPLRNAIDQPMIMKGIAFGLVLSANSCYSRVDMKCDCKVDNTSVAYWPPFNSMNFGSGDNTSEILVLVFDDNSSGYSFVRSEEGRVVCDVCWDLCFIPFLSQQ